MASAVWPVTTQLYKSRHICPVVMACLVFCQGERNFHWTCAIEQLRELKLHADRTYSHDPQEIQSLCDLLTPCYLAQTLIAPPQITCLRLLRSFQGFWEVRLHQLF